MSKKYTEAQVQFIYKNNHGRSAAELTEMFNKHFNTDRMTLKKMKSFRGNHKLDSGLTGRFEKGQTSWNKGLKGVMLGGIKTQFKKGHRPHNAKNVGDETLGKDGYIFIKIAEPNKWKSKHQLIYEKHHGKIPRGNVVIFADKNNRNLDINNLVLVKRSELLLMNKLGYTTTDPKITRSGHAVVKLIRKVQELKNEE